MKKVAALCALFSSFATVFLIAPFAKSQTASSASTTSPVNEELQAKLQDRTRELEEVNKQIAETQQNLKTIQGQKTGLQKELGVLQNNISQLTLNIKSNEINIQKLGLEIQSLNSDLEDIKGSIEGKREAVGQVLRKLQKDANQNFFLSFLQTGTLADGVMETQGLHDVRAQLLSDIETLRQLNAEYEGKVQLSHDKREKITDHSKNLQVQKLIVQDQKSERQVLLAETKNKESLYAKQVEELTKKQQQIAAEMEELDAKLRGEINQGGLPAARPGVIGMPIEGGLSKMTQEYGATAFAQYGYAGKWHNGLDFGGPIGTPIYAAEDGIVTATGDQDKYCYRGAYGKFVVVTHSGKNLVTLYGHLSRQAVQTGATIKRGQLIGYMGKTGYATGPHLHFTVYDKSTFYMRPSKSCGPMPQGGDLNPLKYL